MNQASSPDAAPHAASTMPDAAGLLHELRHQQAELETQNHALRRAQRELAAARDRYRDLYDHAPVGYLTLDIRGRILESNLTAARLLACPREALLRRPLSAYMLQPDADRWHRHLTLAFMQDRPWHFELAFRRANGEPLEGLLDGQRVTHRDDRPSLRVTLTDVTLHRLADADRRAALQVVAAQEADRQRLARELHDDLGQRLSVLKMNLAAMPCLALRDADRAVMVATIDGALDSVRRMASELRPPMLDDLGLSAAVEALARRAARQHGLKLRLHLTAADPGPGDHAALTLYRLLQACLQGLTGHPGLGSLRVDLHDEPGARLLALQVQRRPSAAADPSLPRPERWTALRETAHLMGCSLDAAAVRGGGERVTVRMPLASAARADAPA